ncbi:hypothetical protein E2320_014447 [Naja naja]|nr:hypothetical protein E2320_014447 [Naja naja]
MQPQRAPIWGGKDPAAAAADTLQPSCFSASRPCNTENTLFYMSKAIDKAENCSHQFHSVQPQRAPIWGGKKPSAAVADMFQPSCFSASRPWREPNSQTCSRTLLPPAALNSPASCCFHPGKGT